MSKSNRPTYRLSAAKCAARRVAIGQTQAQVAARAYMPQPHYARVEMADSNPTIDTAMRVARALGCFIEDLVH